MPIRDVIALALLTALAGFAFWHQRQVRRFIRDLEQNADTQYAVHRAATWYWVVNFPIVAVLFFGFPELWVRVGLLLNTFYSLYANLATDYGAMSAAMAAAQKPRESGRAQIVRLAILQKRVDELLVLARAAEITLRDHDDRLADLQENRHDGCH